MENLPAPYRDAEQRQDTVHCGDDSGTGCMRNFLVRLPKFLKDGPAVFAWTWFNKIGNREMHMNCAPINITGGTGTDDNMTEFNGLPDIFIANYPNHPQIANCSTGDGESQILNIPNPGRYGRVIEIPADPRGKPSDYCSHIPPTAALPSFEPNSLTSIVAVATESSSASTGGAAIGTSTVVPTSIMGSSSSISVTHFLTTTLTLPSDTTTVGPPPLTASTGTSSSTYESEGEVCNPDTSTPPVTNSTQNPASSTARTSSQDHGIETITLIDNSTLTTSTITKTSPQISTPPVSNMPLESSSTLGAAPAPTEIFSNPAPAPGSIQIPKLAPNAVPCTKEEGQLECLGGGLQQGLCSHGWAIAQPVAMGTVCDPKTGKIVLAPGAVKWRRVVREGKNLPGGVRYRGVVPA